MQPSTESVDSLPASISLPPIPKRTLLRVWADPDTHAFKSELIRGVRFDCFDCNFVCFDLADAFDHQDAFSFRHLFAYRRWLKMPSTLPAEVEVEPDWSQVEELKMQTWYVKRMREYKDSGK